MTDEDDADEFEEMDVPDEWGVDTDGIGTTFEHESGNYRIDVVVIGNDYYVGLSRRLSASGYQAMVETFGRRVSTIERAADVVADIFDDPLDLGSVTALDAETAVVDGDEIVQFYTVFEETLPDGVDVSDLTFDPDAGGVSTTSAFGLDEDDLDEDHVPIRVDVYPVHESDVTEDDDE